MEKKVKRYLSILMLFCALFITVFFSGGARTVNAKSRKMKTYYQILKSGKYVYCSGDLALYRFNTKTKKVKILYKNSDPEEVVYGMKKKGKYLYYIHTGPVKDTLYRSNVSTGSKKALIQSDSFSTPSYVIYGKKIYVKVTTIHGESKRYSMNLNGKKRKKTSMKPVMKSVRSNVKGYKTKTSENDQGLYDYLITPGGHRYLLGKESYTE